MAIEDIYVTEWGTGPNVLMIHGGPQGNPNGGDFQWSGQQGLAEHGWHVLAPDRPGHGRSPSRGGEDMEIEAVWVAEMLGDGMHLVGHSYGGAIALCATALRPEAVTTLTLIEPAIPMRSPGQPDAAPPPPDLIAALAAIDDPVRAVSEFARMAGVPEEIEPAPTPEQAAKMLDGIRMLRSPFTWDPTNAIAAVKDAGTPVFIVTGNWNTRVEGACQLLAQELQADILTINAGHHFPHKAGMSAGTQFNEALDSFLRAHDVAHAR